MVEEDCSFPMLVAYLYTPSEIVKFSVPRFCPDLILKKNIKKIENQKQTYQTNN